MDSAKTEAQAAIKLFLDLGEARHTKKIEAFLEALEAAPAQ